MKKFILSGVILMFCGLVHAQTDSAAIRADRVNNLLSLGNAKRYKIYLMNTQADQEAALIKTQFKDSTGRAQAAMRIEKKRDAYFQTMMTPTEYNLYKSRKNELLK